MTATATAPGARRPDASPDAPAGTGGRSTPRLPSHQPAAELWLTLVTITVVFGFTRIFSGWDYLGPMLVTAVVTHLGLLLARRRGVSLWATALGALAGFALVSSWLFFAHTTKLGIPTPDTLSAARAALDHSWASFQEVVAPTPTQPGFLLASCFGIFFAVFLADWAAFRLWAPIEGLVPTLTLLIFTSLVGSSRGQVVPSALYALAAMFFVVRHRVAERERSTGWLGDQVDRGSSWLLRVGALLAVGAVLIGAVVGTHLPGAGSDGIFDWHGKGNGPSSRVTISPLVDIRNRLVDQADTQLFTVVSPQRSYWRLTSLDTFDGTIWKSSGRYTSVDGRLPNSLPSGLTDPGLPGEVQQSFRISSLSALWLPAAFEPVSVDAPDISVRYQKESSTLIVDTNVPTSDGQSYTVNSVIPTFTADELRTAESSLPDDIASQDTALPGDLSATVRNLAVSLTAAAPTAYDKAMALQSFFRDTGGFVYDTNVRQGHSDDAIVDFLQVRRGYCEQFAGTFAAMARAAGLASRVAVGFTPGINDPRNPDRYEVRGEHAHAWPEVYLGQYGWVPFEPTPGRGAPNAPYTNVAEQQADNQSRSTTTTAPTSTTATAGTPDSLDADALARQLGQLDSGSGATTAPTASPWPGRLAALGAALAIALLAYLLVVPALLARRRRHRRRAAGDDPAARVRVAWAESEEALALAGAVRKADETSREFAGRADRRLPVEGDGMAALAVTTDAALFASGQVDGADADHAEQIRRSVHQAVTREVPRRRRMLAWLDVRRVVSPRRGRFGKGSGRSSAGRNSA